jgi:hypothetical protein
VSVEAVRKSAQISVPDDQDEEQHAISNT